MVITERWVELRTKCKFSNQPHHVGVVSCACYSTSAASYECWNLQEDRLSSKETNLILNLREDLFCPKFTWMLYTLIVRGQYPKMFFSNMTVPTCSSRRTSVWTCGEFMLTLQRRNVIMKLWNIWSRVKHYVVTPNYFLEAWWASFLTDLYQLEREAETWTVNLSFLWFPKDGEPLNECLSGIPNSSCQNNWFPYKEVGGTKKMKKFSAVYVLLANSGSCCWNWPEFVL